MTAAPEHWHAIEELFAAIVDRSPAERDAALQAFAGPEAVRMEVRSLLAALDAAHVNIDPSPGASHLTLGALATATTSLVGRTLRSWHVVREIGRGGMGTVYEAFRADDRYRQRVAVKTVARAVDSEVVARRFRQEQQILATLEHPNIASLIDGGVTDEGQPYFVMEYVDGQPIDRYAAALRLGLEARLDLFRQICSAVQFAHRNLVVHRDLKPSNILVTQDGTVKLLDFGIAKLLGDAEREAPTLTETGFRAFTTAYASPEQVRGEPISTATDVYSLGVMLYLLVSGHLPIDVEKLTPTAALARICDTIPEPPSRAVTAEAAHTLGSADPRRLARTLEGELDDIVMMALRKEPERRYPTVAAFSDDLKRYLQGQQVVARPDTWRYRVRSFSRRNPKFVVAIGIAALSLLGGAALAGSQARRAGQERDRARTEAARSSRVVSFIEQLLAAQVQGALTEATIASLDQAVEQSRGELADDPVARAAVYRTAAKAYASHNRDERALPLLDSALALDRRHAGPHSIEVARDLIVLARVDYNRGQLDSAVTHAATAVEILRTETSDRPDDLPSALLYHSFALTYAGRPDEGLVVAKEGIDHDTPRGPSAILAYLHMALGEAHIFLGAYAEGEAEYRRSAALYDSLPGEPPTELAIAELGLATLTMDRGKTDSAEIHAERSLELFVRRWGPEHAYTSRVHSILARIAAAKGDSARTAREVGAASKALTSGRLGLVDWIVIESALSQMLLGFGRTAEAVERLQRALAARPDELALAPQILASTKFTLALGLIAERRSKEAIAVLEDVYRIADTKYGPKAAITLGALRRLLFLSEAVGDTGRVRRYAAFFPADSAAAIRARGRAWAR
ncbi:MAG: protein kinase [Gemmatimonadales bacterium]|nr:protein kinase [Gemmatimonadales bacterium]